VSNVIRNGIAALCALALAACSTAPSPGKRAGGFYQDDGPPDRAPTDLVTTPDAVPRIEPFHPYANRPYSALGRRYAPMTEDRPFRQRGLASWYGRQFHGNRTSSGERYDMFAMSAAHPTLPIPSYARVTNVRTGAAAIVRVNDRGPFKHDRVIDLSYAAATRLGITTTGTGEVTVERLTFADIRGGRFDGPAAASMPPVSPRASLPPAPAPSFASASFSPSPSGAWAVQLGAFSIADNAEALRERVAVLLDQNGNGLSIAERSPRVEHEGGVFRVLIGGLTDRGAAQMLADRLERLLDRETALYLRP
jgi:rare lipoprotein A